MGQARTLGSSAAHRTELRVGDGCIIKRDQRARPRKPGAWREGGEACPVPVHSVRATSLPRTAVRGDAAVRPGVMLASSLQ
jgi:hypothetical protein